MPASPIHDVSRRLRAPQQRPRRPFTACAERTPRYGAFSPLLEASNAQLTYGPCPGRKTLQFLLTKTPSKSPRQTPTKSPLQTPPLRCDGRLLLPSPAPAYLHSWPIAAGLRTPAVYGRGEQTHEESSKTIVESLAGRSTGRRDDRETHGAPGRNPARDGATAQPTRPDGLATLPAPHPRASSTPPERTTERRAVAAPVGPGKGPALPARPFRLPSTPD